MPGRLRSAISIVGVVAALATSLTGSSPDLAHIPLSVLVPDGDRYVVLSQFRDTRPKRSAAELDATTRKISTSLRSATESEAMSLAKQAAGSAARARTQTKILALHLESVIWAESKDEPLRAAVASSHDLLLGNKQKPPVLAPLVKEYVTSLYRGEDKAIIALKDIIEKKPSSLRAGEANALLGDYFFSLRDFPTARSHYLSAMGHRNLSRPNEVSMRLAWCHFQSDQVPEAIGGLKTTVSAIFSSVGGTKQPATDQLSPKTKTKKSPRSLPGRNPRREYDHTVAQESLRLLAYIYAEQGDIQTGKAALKAHHGSSYIPDLVYTVAAIGAVPDTATSAPTAGQFPFESADLFRQFAKDFPSDARSSTAEFAAVELDLRNKRFELAVKHLERLFSQAMPQNVIGALQAVASNAGDTIYRTATLLPDSTLLPLARKAYDESLALAQKASDKTAGNQDAARIHWILGELALVRNEPEQAGMSFLDIARLPRRATTISSKKGVSAEKKVALHKMATENAVRLLSKTKDQGYIEACRVLTKVYGDSSPLAYECDTNLPDALAAKADPEAAKTAWERVARKFAGRPEGQNAVRSIFTRVSPNSKEQFSRASALLELDAYNTGEIGDYLRNLKFDADLAQVQAEPDPKKRYRPLLEVARRYTLPAKSPMVWLAAAKLADELGMLDEAAESLNTLIATYPKSTEAPDGLFLLGSVSEKRFRLEDARKAYATLVNKHPEKSVRNTVALQKQCELAVAVEASEALASCSALVTAAPDLARPQLEKLINKAVVDGKLDFLQQLVEQHYIGKLTLTPSDQIVAWYRVYQGHKRANATADAAVEKIMAIYSQSPSAIQGEALRAIGEIRYRGVFVTKSMYDNVTLTSQGGKIDALAASIATKKKAMDNIVFNFGKVVQVGDPGWAAAAYYQMGHAHESFSAMLANPPAVEGISPQDVIAKLADQADALSEEALRLYNLALSTTWRHQTVNEFAVQAIDGIARLSGTRLRYEDWLESPLYINSQTTVPMTTPIAEVPR